MTTESPAPYEYTPTRAEIKASYVAMHDIEFTDPEEEANRPQGVPQGGAHSAAEFERWIAAHDQEVIARFLQEGGE